MEQLYFGAAYYDEYMPESRIDTDFSLMRRAGMNVIRIAESTWSTWEPQDGQFDFTSLHRMLRGAEKYGISVIVGTPTYAIPPWLARKYPDALAETHAGPGRYGPRQNMDITHPGYRFHAERIIRRLLAEVQPYPNVIGFQLDNETKAYDVCSRRAQELFKKRLQEKFGTVEALNKAFGLAYWSNSLGCWADLPDVRGTINGSLAAEYAAFQRSLVTDFLQWQRSIVDEYRRPDQFVTHNFDFAWEPFHAAGLQPEVDQNRAARACTVAGCDIYYPTGGKLTGMELHFCCDVARSLKNGEPFLVMETQAQGPLCSFSYPGQLRLAALSLLSGGAEMVEYWHWHSIHNAVETYWKGILSHDLTPGVTYEEIADIGRVLQRLGPQLTGFRQSRRVAVMVSSRSLTGIEQDASFSGFRYNRDALLPVYDALFRLNISCDIIWDSQRDFAAYDLVVLPSLYCAEDGLIEALKQYVRGGGHLLATVRSFFTDEYVTVRHAQQPYGMTEVFGLHYDRFCPGENCEPGAGKFMELLTADRDTRILRSYVNPAFADYACATLHDYGGGSAGYIGADLSREELEKLFSQMLPAMGISLPEQRWPVITRRGTNGQGQRLRYVFNYSGSPQHFAAGRPCTDLLNGKSCGPGRALSLPAWAAAILEEDAN